VQKDQLSQGQNKSSKWLLIHEITAVIWRIFYRLLVTVLTRMLKDKKNKSAL